MFMFKCSFVITQIVESCSFRSLLSDHRGGIFSLKSILSCQLFRFQVGDCKILKKDLEKNTPHQHTPFKLIIHEFKRENIMKWLLCRLCLFAISFFVYQTLIASSADSIKKELGAFLQLYNNSQEKLTGWSSIAYAIENDYDAIAEYLINKGEKFDNHYEVKHKNKKFGENIHYKHPFLTAITKGKVLLVSLMVKKVSINYTQEYWRIEGYAVRYRRPLHIAITDCPHSYEIVEILLKAGAVVWQRSYFQPEPSTEYLEFNPLTYAILEKKLDVAGLLIDYKAETDTESLCQAIRIDFLEGVVFLLERGTEVDKTVLWEAVHQNNFRALILLLNVNSDIEFDMITYANANGFYEVADILMEVYTVSVKKNHLV